MSETVFSEAIERQTAARKAPIESLMNANENTPSWLNPDNQTINTELLSTMLIDKYGYHKSGQSIKDRNNKTISRDEIKLAISKEISPFITDSARRLRPLYDQIILYFPKDQGYKLSPFTAAELAERKLEKTPFIVDEILPCGLTILAAPPKTGKSWLCLALADSVATGSTFWGRKVERGAVLYMALEDNEYRLQSRLRALGSTMPRNLYMICRSALCLDNGLMDQLEDWINSQADARIIILDTLQRVKGAPQRGLDAYAADYARLGPLQELAIRKKVAIVAVHHFRKQSAIAGDDIFEKFSGSNALFGAADCGWAIYGKRGAEEMNLHIAGRDIGEVEYKISFRKELHRWQMLGNIEILEKQRAIDEYKNNPIVVTIREFMQENKGAWYRNGISKAELIDAIISKTGDPSVTAYNQVAFGKLLDRLHPQMIEYDNITFKRKNSGPKRVYIFQYVKPSESFTSTIQTEQESFCSDPGQQLAAGSD